MKKIILFSLGGLLLSTIILAQTQQDQPKNVQKLSKKDHITRELTHSLNRLYTGAAFVGAGATLTTIGTFYRSDDKISRLMIYTGISATLIGLVFSIESHSHIRNAAKYLNLNISTNSATITLKF